MKRTFIFQNNSTELEQKENQQGLTNLIRVPFLANSLTSVILKTSFHLVRNYFSSLRDAYHPQFAIDAPIRVAK